MVPANRPFLFNTDDRDQIVRGGKWHRLLALSFELHRVISLN